jgi:hypothetical protein
MIWNKLTGDKKQRMGQMVMKKNTLLFRRTAWICVMLMLISMIEVKSLTYASDDLLKQGNCQSKSIALSDEELANLTNRASMNPELVSLKTGEGSDGVKIFLIVLGALTLIGICVFAIKER